MATPFLGGIDVRLENFFRGRFFVIAESVGGFEFVSREQGFGNTGVGSLGECCENTFEAVVESLIVEVCGREFFFEPSVCHGGSGGGKKGH